MILMFRLPMSAKLYWFPKNPEYRAKFAAMPTRKRKKLLHMSTLYWRILNSRLERILSRREEIKKNESQ